MVVTRLSSLSPVCLLLLDKDGQTVLEMFILNSEMKEYILNDVISDKTIRLGLVLAPNEGGVNCLQAAASYGQNDTLNKMVRVWSRHER